MKQIELSAGTIQHEDTDGDGPVLVLLHGLMTDATLWDESIADPASQLIGRRYVQHNPFIADGIDGFKGFLRYVRETFQWKTDRSSSIGTSCSRFRRKR